MRILIASSSRNVIGGVEKYLQSLFPPLIAAGCEPGVLHETPLVATRQPIDPPQLRLPSWDLSALGTADTLRSIAEWGPEVVYNHGLENGELEDSLLRTYPTVLYAHNYYGTCGIGGKSHSFPIVRPCTRQFGPACAFLHYPRRCGGLNPITSLHLFRRQAQRRSGLPSYQAVLTASEHMHREYLRHGVDPSKLHLVPLPVTETRPPVPPRQNRPPRGRILMLARLTHLKGADHLIRAVAQARKKLPHLAVTIAGDGSERPKLERLARKLNVPVEFPGWVPTTATRALMEKADLLAVPSLWPEPFGLVGIEAGCLGLPSVAYAIGGIPDWLIPGHSGELAPADPPKPEALADAIVRALGDPKHYARLCQGAWEVAGRFSWDAHLNQLLPILSGGKRETISLACAELESSPVREPQSIE